MNRTAAAFHASPAARILSLGLIWFFPSIPSSAAGPLWQPLPLVTQAQRASGMEGGEGCQVLQAIAVDPSGRFLVMGTDVGGMYRSLDGGGHWEPSNRGFKPRGAAAFAIDPADPRRVLALGANSSAFSWNGLWISNDQAASWKPVLPMNAKGTSSLRECLAFAPSGKDGVASTAYFLAPADGGGGLWRSGDGGLTWSLIQKSFADGIVKAGSDGKLFLAVEEGLYASENSGDNFGRVLEGPIRGLDVLSQSVYACGPQGVLVSNNVGKTFAFMGGQGLPPAPSKGLGLRNLKVSPVDTNHMILENNAGPWGAGGRYFSADGGKHWTQCSLDSTGSFMPTNGRNGMFAWSPSDPQQVWSFGGDYVTLSTDGGRSFHWAGNGDNGLACSGIFNFNVGDPGLLLITSQDYNSVLTADAGGTWSYLKVSGKGWGGFNYGGYALSPSVLFAGDAPGWKDPRTLKVSNDGGTNWYSTGLTGNTKDAGCGDPGDPNTAFWDQYRTADGGKTWAPMQGCEAVFTGDPKAGLFGASGNQVVRSTDHGASWKPVADLPAPARDLAYDPKRGRLMAAAVGLYTVDLATGKITDLSPALHPDQESGPKVSSVAVDPQDPDVVYAGGRGNQYLSDQAVRRSLDGGKTWTALTLKPGDPGPDGGREAVCVRVHPVTRFLYVATSCFGLWKYPPPDPQAR